MLPGGVLGAFGLGLALVPATIVAVEGVPRALSGLASGVLNTSRFVGAALGLAVLSTIAAHHTDSEVGSGTSAAQALTDGFDLQFDVGAIFCLVGVIAAVVLLRPQRAAGVPEARARRRAGVGRSGAAPGRTNPLDFPPLMRFYEFESRGG